MTDHLLDRSTSRHRGVVPRRPRRGAALTVFRDYAQTAELIGTARNQYRAELSRSAEGAFR